MTFGEILGLTSAAVTLLGLVFVYINARRANRSTEKKVSIEEQQAAFGANLQLNAYIDTRVEKLVDERIGDVRKELTEVKANERTRTNAITKILRTIANQWPTGSPGPFLDPADIAAIEETIPSQWLPR